MEPLKKSIFFLSRHRFKLNDRDSFLSAHNKNHMNDKDIRSHPMCVHMHVYVCAYDMRSCRRLLPFFTCEGGTQLMQYDSLFPLSAMIFNSKHLLIKPPWAKQKRGFIRRSLALLNGIIHSIKFRVLKVVLISGGICTVYLMKHPEQ